uniref:Bactericidal permeability-increasing protein n=1 Tax=Anas platyrhynchos TaxID=8839 RepID=A0A8B9TWC5_ANAPL
NLGLFIDVAYGFNTHISPSKLRIGAVDFPETSASFIPGIGISLSMAHASATISADWRMETWLLKDQGGITVSISGLFIAVIFKVSRDSTGHLSILLHNCQLSVNGIRILSVKPLLMHSDKYKCLQAEIPVNNSLQGTVYPVGNHTDPPFVPAPFGLSNHGDSMLYLGVSNYFLKSASLAYYRAGAFNITISKETLQEAQGPGNPHSRSSKYSVTPYPVMLKLMATETPLISLQPDSFTLEIQGSMEVFAVLPDSTNQSLFTMNMVSTRNKMTFNSGLNISFLLSSFLLLKLCIRNQVIDLYYLNMQIPFSHRWCCMTTLTYRKFLWG